MEMEKSDTREEPPLSKRCWNRIRLMEFCIFRCGRRMKRSASFYEITSKQPLSRLLEGQTIQAEQIRALILGIARSLDHMEQYLISEKSVLLNPEYLYVDPESLKVWLCLVPGLECDFPEDYSRLLEYLLGKVDHRIRSRWCWPMACIRKQEKKLTEWRIFCGWHSRKAV